MLVAQWKQTTSDKYYCSNCRLSTDIPTYICNFCGASMTNFESILNDLTIAKNYDIIKKIMERIEEDE